ncbi:MAG: hypothetical protein WD044_11590 [Dongiaceae bacterium]
MAGATGPGFASADEMAFHLAVEGGEIAGGAPTLRVTEGDDVTIELVSDDEMEIHLHGYDITVVLAPGEAAAFAFRADIAGRFPAEPHDHGGGDHNAVFYLEVYPK